MYWEWTRASSGAPRQYRLRDLKTRPVKITEELLWRFIDDDLSEEEEIAVAQAISDDEEVGNLYLELLETHDQFAGFFKDKQKAQGATSFTTMLGTMRNIAN